MSLRNCGRAVFLWLVLSAAAFAQDEQQTYIYEYDAAGNLIAIRASINSGPPTINDVNPPLLNINNPVSVIVSGTNLFAGEISATPGELLVSNVTSISDSEMRFDILALPLPSPVDQRFFTITTPLGSAVSSFAIAEPLPIIAVSPSPLLIGDGQTSSLSVLLDKPYDSDVTIEAQILDTDIAQIVGGGSPSTIDVFIPQGETEVSFGVSAVGVGATELQLTEVINAQLTTVSLRVATPEPLPEGTNFAAARSVGIRSETFGRGPEQIDSKPVGVAFRGPLVEAGESIQARSVGVRKTILVRAGESIDAVPVGITKTILVNAGETIDSAPVGVEVLTE